MMVKIAAAFGNDKARRLVQGQARALDDIARYEEAHPERSLEGCVWIHAASVGEFEQARPLIEKLRDKQPWKPILLTFYSPSGYEMRKHYDQVDLVTYLPFATKRNAKAFMELVRPSMAILVKYEFWPAYIRQAVKHQVKLYSIASIFRKEQYFFRWWAGSQRRLLKQFTHLYVQDENSRGLLKRHGITEVSIVGDTRFDRVTEIAAEAKQVEVVERFVRDMPQVIVAGSTWPEDEELLFRYVEEHPYVRLVLVPHEIDEEHMHRIFNIWRGRYVRMSEVNEHNLFHCQTLVVDTMGLLASIYQYGHVAYVGGGFGEGIHNTIEAAVYGLPVVFGPNYMHFREARALIQQGGGCSVKTYEELEVALDEMLRDRQKVGQKAAQYVAGELGATEQLYKALFGKRETVNR